MAVTEKVRRERQARRDARMEAAAEVVPIGPYCYRHTGEMVERPLPNGGVARYPEIEACTYWKRNGGKSEHRDGYCRLLRAGDWMPAPHGTMLLWDMVKECSINRYDMEDVE